MLEGVVAASYVSPEDILPWLQYSWGGGRAWLMAATQCPRPGPAVPLLGRHASRGGHRGGGGEVDSGAAGRCLDDPDSSGA